MPHFPHRAVLQEHFDNVEAQLHRRVLESAQVIERGAREPPAPLFVHRRRRPPPFLGGARLHFNEYQTIPVAEDEVNLAPLVRAADQAQIGLGMLKHLQQGAATLGDAFRNAQADAAAQNADPDALNSFILIGDPAGR